MKNLLAILTAVAVLTASAFAGPYDSWAKYRIVTLNTNTAAVTGNLTNYPLLVRLTNANPASGSDVLSDDATGASLRFTSFDGDTAYAYEIDTWTASSAAIWVKVPAVTGSSNTGARVRMYWGKEAAEDASDGNAVFSTGDGFVGAWHLGDTSGTNPRPNAITGRNPATMRNFSGYTASSGIIGFSDSLTGGTGGSGGVPAARRYLSIDSTAAGDASNHFNFSDGNFAFTAWVNPQALTPFARLFGINSASTFVGGGDNRIFFATSGTNGQLVARHGSTGTTASNAANTNAADGRLVINQWQHVAMTISRGPTNDTVRIFRDGEHITAGIPYVSGGGGGQCQPATSGTSCGLRPTAVFPNTARGYVSLGRDFINVNGDSVFRGKIDEARFASARRSASWIKLDFETQKGTVTAVTLGSTQEQEQGASVPGAPTNVAGTAGNGQVSVTFTAPEDDGGAEITSYTVTSSPGTFTGTGGASPIVVSGLTNGVAYTFTVKATNSEGEGAASAPSGAVTPRTVPGAPTSVVGTPGSGQVSVAFDAPGSNGGSAITGYTVTSDPGDFTGTGAVSPIIVTGLTNGVAYTFTVVATNEAGDGAASAPSGEVTPVGVPGAPTNVAGTAGNGQVSVAFDAPGSNGGSAITGYTVTSDPGGFEGTGAASPIIVSGLANGTPYTFTVTATNSEGDGAASAPSSPATPFTVPGAPTNVVATAGSASASVAFDAPAANGAAITNYTVTSSPGDFTGTGAASPIVVSGLSNGTAYTFTVVAANAAGDGAASAPSNAATPAAAPTITYPGGPFSYPTGVRIVNLVPVKGGGPILSYSIDPANITALTNLQFNSVTGIISGTSTVPADQLFVVTAHGVGGSTDTAHVSISTTGPTLSYTGGPFSLPLGVAIEPLRPTKGPAAITGYAIDPALTAATGLQFNTNTGIISGTPTVTVTGELFVVTANGLGGSTDTAHVIITTTGPTLSYTGGPFSFPLGAAIAPLRPTKGPATITGYAIAPPLTAATGLQFNTSTGAISGIPTVQVTSAEFEVTANGPGGSQGTTEVVISTTGPTLSYTGGPFSFPLGAAITPLSPVKGPAAITSYSVDPSLETIGLQLNTNTGVISGIPTGEANFAEFEVTAHGPGGSTGTTEVVITTTGPTLSYAGTPYTLTLGVAIAPIRPAKGPATITGYAIDPPNITALTGLQFNTGTGIISGVPTVVVAALPFEVTAGGLDGTEGTAQVVITTQGQAPVITYPNDGEYDFPLGAAITVLRPTKGGGPIVNYSIAPPDITARTRDVTGGLQFNTNTGAISGTPTKLLEDGDAEAFIVTAHGLGGATGTFDITINTHSTGKMNAGGPLVFRVSGSSMSYTFQVGGEAALEAVTMRIADMSGRTVWSRTVNPSQDGSTGITWDGRAQSGMKAPAGMYIVHVASKADGKTTRVVRKTVTLDAD